MKNGNLRTNFIRFDYANQTAILTSKIPSIEEIVFTSDGIFIDSEGKMYSTDGYVIYPQDLKYLIAEVGISPEIFAVVKQKIREYFQKEEKGTK